MPGIQPLGDNRRAPVPVGDLLVAIRIRIDEIVDHTGGKAILPDLGAPLAAQKVGASKYGLDVAG